MSEMKTYIPVEVNAQRSDDGAHQERTESRSVNMHGQGSGVESSMRVAAHCSKTSMTLSHPRVIYCIVPHPREMQLRSGGGGG
jgi:hypothetical protein